MKKIAVLTSGGDAPGMNAAIRAVVRRGIYCGLEVYGVRHGYDGLMDGDFQQMDLGSVGDIIHRGGTILRSARSEAFKSLEGQEKAITALNNAKIDGLVVIGGDGSFRGADKLNQLGLPTIGVPGSIDNDISGTDYSIGFDTAVNTVVEAIDKIRDTAYSHERICIIEVMGRHAGIIALWTGICAGAESIIIPEVQFDLEDIMERIQFGQKRGKMHSIIVVGEGAISGNEVKEKLKDKFNLDTNVIVLGYLQRGGTPTIYDRMMASKMGVYAVNLLIEGKKGLMVGWKKGQLTHLNFQDAFKEKHTIDLSDYYLARSISI
ncbi:6-phosphofructokinase [Aeribacillus composti]|uniref:6-phosphofructokinase n=1 Tax=Aeribacillus composti TaxID=1868734 RepID=UPI002E1F3AD0|nr:6-phosphofructokinase [Aeribacillus composti]